MRKPCRSHEINMHSTRHIAEHATFQSFANCYLREINHGLPVKHLSDRAGLDDCIELTFPGQQTALRIEVCSWSLCGPHKLGTAWSRRTSESVWRQIEPFSAIYILIADAYQRIGDGHTDALRHQELELLQRVLQSYQSTKLYLDARDGVMVEDAGFINAEQSLVFGHWLHPTPKSLQGMTEWQQSAYAPELKGQFQLVYFAADHGLVRHASAFETDAAGIVSALIGDVELDLAPNEMLIPMHPLQAEALLLDADVRKLQSQGLLRCLGPQGPDFTATSSVRTVYNPQQKWMPKFSLPVRITNSVRLNRRHELGAGVAMAKLFVRAGIPHMEPTLRVIHDPAYMTLDLPGRAESGFEVIFRQNPFRTGHEESAVTIAALTAEPLPGTQSRLAVLLQKVADEQRFDISHACLTWFSKYLECAVEPLIRVYDTFGIALEAHQQNSLLDVTNGYPETYYYRDNQGFYLSNRYRDQLSKLLPEAETIDGLFFDDREIRDRFAYYLMVNQVFSIITRMGHDGLTTEDLLLDMLQQRLLTLSRTLKGAGRDFALSLLDRPTITAKANLMIRLLDVDELSNESERQLYTSSPNPLCRLSGAFVREAGRAIAS